MATVAFVVHPFHPEAGSIAARAEAWLTERGHDVIRLGDVSAGGEHAGTAAGPSLRAGVDLAVSLGGDGTMLRTVALACGQGVPVLGVNLGRLGYLTEIEPHGLDAALERLAGRDPQKARLVELRYFAGLTGDQAAAVLGISPSSADRLWTYTRAWLRRDLGIGGDPDAQSSARGGNS